MTTANKRKQSDALVDRMIELAGNDYNCSQIIMTIALERAGKKNPDLVRAVSGLGDGCGFSNETCGILTGSACMLSLFAGKGSDSERASEKLLPMLQDLGDWFEEEIKGKYGSTRCNDIVGDRIGTPEGMQICGRLLFRAVARADEILSSYGFVAD